MSIEEVNSTFMNVRTFPGTASSFATNGASEEGPAISMIVPDANEADEMWR
jgi:hypothetical protein